MMKPSWLEIYTLAKNDWKWMICHDFRTGIKWQFFHLLLIDLQSKNYLSISKIEKFRINNDFSWGKALLFTELFIPPCIFVRCFKLLSSRWRPSVCYAYFSGTPVRPRIILGCRRKYEVGIFCLNGSRIEAWRMRICVWKWNGECYWHPS